MSNNRVWHGLHPVPDYRLWIYSVNGLIITFQCLVGYLAYASWRHPYWPLLPLPPSAGLWITFAVVFCIQWFACVCGLLGVCVSSRDFIKIYWCLMIPLLFVDIVQFGVASYQLMKVHLHFATPSALLVENSSALCPVWLEFASEFGCAADCAAAPPPAAAAAGAAPAAAISCSYSLLRWMHGRLDLIGVIMCFILFPLKIIVILALREDIQELFEEILYSDNERLYKHWALGDEDEEADYGRERNAMGGVSGGGGGGAKKGAESSAASSDAGTSAQSTTTTKALQPQRPNIIFSV